MGSERRRKISVFDSAHPTISTRMGNDDLRYRRRKSLQARKNSRDKDFFVPDAADEWVLPEYRSLFHHIFLREEDETGSSSGVGSSTSHSQASFSPALHRRRKISPSGSTGSATTSEDDGPLCNFVKKLKKVFHISENNDEPQNQEEEVDARHAWLDEIPIEICDKLRHIHIYV